MKIDDQISLNNIDALPRKPHDGSRLPAVGNTPKAQVYNDKVVLSPKARELQDARIRLDGLPDVNVRRVAQIQQQIETNTYKIDGRTIAERMLRTMALNSGW